jgi:hypothetical protein
LRICRTLLLLRGLAVCRRLLLLRRRLLCCCEGFEQDVVCQVYEVQQLVELWGC